MKESLRQFSLITSLNFKLLNRSSLRGFYGWVLNGFVIALYALMIWVFISASSEGDNRVKMSLVMTVVSGMYIVISLSSLMLRYSERSRTVVPGSMAAFPCSDTKTYFIIVWDMVVNINSVGLITLCLIATPLTSDSSAFILLPISFFAGLGFIVMTGVWLSDFYVFMGKLFQKYGKIIGIIPAFGLLAFNAIFSKWIMGQSENKLSQIPVLGWTGSILNSMYEGDWKRTLNLILIIIGLSILGILIGRLAMKRFKYSLYL